MLDFDEDAAERLAGAATLAADALRRLGPGRGLAVEDALVDAAGGYAQRLVDSVHLESTDRVRLARALDDLAGQVRAVARQADDERRRRADHAAWRTREQARCRSAAADPLGVIGIRPGFVVDPEPSDLLDAGTRTRVTP